MKTRDRVEDGRRSRLVNAWWRGTAMLCVLFSGCASDARESTSETATLLARADLRIDADLADLVPIAGMAVSGEGAIAVLQQHDHTVKVFDQDGALLRTVGGLGQGPGEFQLPARLGWVGDTLWVSDAATRRVTFSVPRRDTVWTSPILSRGVPRPDHGGALQPVSGLAPEAAYSTRLFLAGGMEMPPDVPSPTAGLVRVSDEGVIQGKVMQFAGMPLVEMGLIPFLAQQSWAVAPDGRRLATLAVGQQGAIIDTLHVIVLDETGELVWERYLTHAAEHIPEAVVDSAVAERVDRWMITGRAVTAGMRDELRRAIPRTYAGATEVLVGSDYSVWVELREHVGGRPWLRLAADGRDDGHVLVPANVKLYAVGSQYAWGVETGELGLEHVVRFPLE